MDLQHKAAFLYKLQMQQRSYIVFKVFNSQGLAWGVFWLCI